jgi:hypothetical protein
MLSRLRPRLSPALICVAATALVAGACSATSESDSEFTGPGSGPGSGAGSGEGGAGPGVGGSSSGAPGGSGSFAGGSGPGSGGGNDGCSEAAKLVYVIGQDNELLSFDPPTTTFTSVGYISCPQNGGFATPFSMAVARSGMAYVLFSDGKLYLVDTSNAACTATSYVPGQVFFTFGMGFVSDSPNSEEETLYVADYAGTGIGKIDLATLQLTKVGDYSGGLTGPAELTGTGDARLFGFFMGTPVIVAEIDKSNAAILTQAPQPTVNIGSGWAFAFWGGDFWLFTDPAGFSSQVDRYQPSSGTTTTVKTGVGTTIVGAGVSTCAPVEPPS